MLRLLLKLVLALAITLGLMEAGARWVLGFRPISTESTVWTHHPVLGWAHEPGASEVFVRLGFSQPIQINSRGLREREVGYERTPGVQRMAVMPQKPAGMRRLPPVSEPVHRGSMPVASATAEPPDEPPQVRAVSKGLTVAP